MLRVLPLVLSLAGLAFAGSAQAHDVSGSDVTVYAQGLSVEVWQSTPHGVAHSFLKAEQAADTEKAFTAVQRDEMSMIEISNGWIISSNQNHVCPLARQAHRRVHNDEQIQMRYLFTCPEGQTPAQISMPWLDSTPKAHLIFLTMDKGRGERTYFVERPNYTFPLGE